MQAQGAVALRKGEEFLLNEMYVQYALEFVRVARHAGGPLMFEAYDRPQPALPEPLIDVPPPKLAVRPAPAF